ncbi:MAG: T9SS type A sorting domain-containing protein [FCB group bacterium]|nr:T9SS type A sorting domain-containing protein [FCB group bacterium]
MWKVISIIILTLTSSTAQITSTESGGNWSASGSWIGGVVPTAGDDVIIDGITIASEAACANLTVNNTGTLTNNNSFQTLTVNGDILNNGTVTQNPSGWLLTVELTGNLINNSEWSCGPTHFIGSVVQEVNAAPGTVFSCSSFGSIDATTSVLAAADISFAGTEINFAGGQLEMPSGSTLTIAGGSLQNTILVGNGAFLEVNGSGYLANNTISDMALRGIVQVKNGNIFTNITVADTLQQTNTAEFVTIEVGGNFINNGLIRDINAWGLILNINGNIESQGSWTNHTVSLTGSSDQTISTSSIIDFSCKNFTDSDPGNTTFLAGNMSFTDTEIDLAGASVTVLSRGQISLVNNTHLYNSVINGSGNIFYMDPSSFLQNSTLANMVLQGTIQLRGVNAFEDITNEGILQNDSTWGGYASINSSGMLINNATIQQGNAWEMTINISGNLTNNGTWANSILNFTGSGEQHLYTTDTASFSTISVGVNDPAINLLIHGSLDFSSAVVDLGGATLTMTNGGMISMVDSQLQNGFVTGNGADLSGNGNGYLRQLDCQGINIHGIVQVRDEVTFSDNVTVVDTLQNDSNWAAFSFTATDGLFTNNGLIRQGNSWNFTTEIAGDISGTGRWANSTVRFTNSTGRTIHQISSTGTADFACANFLYTEGTSGVLNIDTDIIFTGTTINFYDNPIFLANSSSMSLEGSALTHVNINGGDGVLVMHNGAYAAQTEISDLALEGITQVRSDVILSGNITVEDTLQNDSNYQGYANALATDHLTVNGLIRDATAWPLTIEITGDVTNNGTWTNREILFTGVADQTISSDDTATFGVNNFNDTDPASAINVTSNLSFDGTVLADFNGAHLNFINRGQLSVINSGFTGADVGPDQGVLYMDGNAYLRDCTFHSFTLEGTIQIRQNVVFEGFTILNGTLQNHTPFQATATLSTVGTFVNNGLVQQGNAWPFTITILGNIRNNGTWTNNPSLNSLEGASYQYIVLLEDQPLESVFQIVSSSGDSNFQWFLDGVEINGETGSALGFFSVSSSDYGTYTCTTNQGPSREVQIGHIPGCTDPTAVNYDPLADVEDLSCAFAVYGCTDTQACNFDPVATDDDGSCLYTDCAGDCGGAAYFDNCNICSEGNSGHTANSDEDCNGDCFGSAVEDSCGVCSGGNSGHLADSDIDCLGVCFGGAVEDCSGLCGGTAIIDNCGDCVEGDTGLSACAQDCNSVWGGDAIENECGCVGGDTGLDPAWCWGCTDAAACNYNDTATQDDGSCLYLDCGGDCGGNAYEDDCGECDSNPDNDNLSCLDPEMINTFYPITQSNYSTTDCSGEPYEVVDSDPDSWVETLLPDGTWSSVAFGIPAAYGIWYTPDATTLCFTYNPYSRNREPLSDGFRMNRTSNQRDLQCIQYEKLYNPDGSLLEVIYTYPDMGDPPCFIQVFGVLLAEDCAGVPGGNAQLDDCGVCCGGSTGLDCSYYNGPDDFGGLYDCAGDCSGVATFDDCGVCSGGSSAHEPNSDQDCNGLCFGSASVDECGVCCGGDTEVECSWFNNSEDFGGQYDCSGTCGGVAFFDDCQVCSGGTTTHTANSDMDCNGDCFGDAIVDNCGYCCGGFTDVECSYYENETTFSGAYDCAGLCDGEAFFDDCQVCSGGSTGHVANTDQDCNGDCFGEAVENECGCVGGSTGLAEDFCYGCMDETALNYDPGALFPCEPDCCSYEIINGCTDAEACNYNPAANNDDGSCLYYDCTGECGGTAVNDDFDGCCQPTDIDDCGVCFGDNTEMDCEGICFGEAFIDDCGICSGGGTGHTANSDIDDCGICFGDNTDMDCEGVCFGEAFQDDCDICSGGTTGHDANSEMDCTGECFGTAINDSFDGCCQPAEIDDCGICFGDTSSCTGCMEETALNYDPEATIPCDPDCCIYEQTQLGCTDPEALNFDAFAIEDDGSCLYMGDVNADGVVDVSDVVVMVEIILYHYDPTDWELLAGDFWEDGRISIFDIVYLVELILSDGLTLTEPISYAEIVATATTVLLNTDGQAAGIQLTVRGDFEITNIYLPGGWELYRSLDCILILSLNGRELSGRELFSYSGSMSIDAALVTDWQHSNLNADVRIIPDGFGLTSIYPNPFNPVTNITYSVPVETQLSLRIYDLEGKEVNALVNKTVAAGSYSIRWDGTSLPSGIYFVILETPEFCETQKIMLLK